MKVSVDLLNSYLKNKLSTEKMVEVIERTEVEVEEILYAKNLDNKIISAKVVEVSNHPNADKLKKARVDNGNAIIDIVCGAPNIREGLVVALAQVGSILPSGFEISEAEIRGEISHGMLCSERELGWGEDHDGIIELDSSLPIGKSLCDIAKMSDTLDVKTPSNRWDYLSLIGLGREIAATDSDNILVQPETADVAYSDKKLAKIEVNDDICGAFYTVKASVKVGQKSPRWLADNLQASGVRTINPIVDITNFVMLEYGQPSHAYDMAKIQGSIGVRYADKDENITTLDGTKLKLTDSDLVIVDNSGPIALAGVMGGISTETDNNTKEVLIEIANFDKTTVRRSALRHGIRTEASTRFEKGLPIALPSLAAKRIIELLKKVCEAKIIETNEQLYSHYPTINLGMRLRKADKFIGYRLDEKEVMSALAKRGFEPKHFSFTKEIKAHLGKPYMYGAQIASEKLKKFDRSLLTCYIYSKAGLDVGRTAQNQFDKGMQIPDESFKPGDLLFLRGDEQEEKKKIGHVGMYIGNSKVLQASSTQKEVVLSPITKFTKARNYAGARRYVENFNHIISVQVPWWRNDVTMEVDLFEEIAKTQNYNQMPETLPDIEPTATNSHQLLPSYMQLRQKLISLGLIEVMTYSFISKDAIDFIDSNDSKYLQIENPLSSEQDYLRTNLLPSHLRVAANNQNSEYNAMFEISRVYEKLNDKTEEKWSLGLTVWGNESLLRIKGIIDNIFGWYGVELGVTRYEGSESYISGRAAIISKNLGDFGQIKPQILKKFDIKNEVSFAQLEIRNIVLNKKKITAKPLLPYQIIYKDITMEVPLKTLYTDIEQDLSKHAVSVEFIGEYQNEELKNISAKRLSVRVGFDLGSNPKAKQISQKIAECGSVLKKIQKARVL